ncbi:MAG: ABC transporter permease [Gammaproteobacteria bacterium]|nr:ABC transporter permease [Gammaproteobacteria bacterium]
MSLLATSQLRFLTRTPWSTLTVLLGITLGVASVVAVHQISLRVTDSLQAATPPHLAGLTHLLEVESGITTAKDYFDLRERWRGGDLPGVRALLPIIEGQLNVHGRRTLVFATDWLAADGLRADSAATNGARPGWDSVIVDSSFGLAVDDVLTVAGRKYPVSAVIDAGIGAAVFADIGTGQELLGVGPDVISYVGVAKADPMRRVKNAVEALLPGVSAGFENRLATWPVNGWRVRRVESELPMLAFANSVIFNLGALGSLALVVAWFLIYQVGVIWHRRRRALMDRLFAMGVSRGELTRSFVAAFIVLGVVATVLGVFAGLFLARVLSEISSAGFEVPGSMPGLTIWVAVKAAVSGVAVSGLGGWLACRHEWSQEDLAAPVRVGRWLVPIGLCVVLLAGIGLPQSGMFGGFATVLAVSLLVMFCVRPLLEHLRRISARLPGRLLTRIGLREVTWYPHDLSVAIGALSLAMATSMGVGLMVDSFRADFSIMLDQRLADDLFVDGAGQDLSAVLEWLSTQPDVERFQAYGRSRERLQGEPVELGFTRFSLRESARYGLARELAPGEVMISERLAESFGLSVGDDVEVRKRQLRVVAVFSGFGDAGRRMLVDELTAEHLGVLRIYDRVSISRDAGDGSAAQLGSRLLSRFGGELSSLRIQPRDEMRKLALDIFDRTFAITTALTLLALLVAVIGMYNALQALRLNQAPSYRLLDALGVSGREQRRIALLRAGAVGSVAVMLALPLGIAMAWLLCNVINPRAFGWSLNLRFAAVELLTPMSLGLLAALAAGLLPLPVSERHEEL